MAALGRLPSRRASPPLVYASSTLHTLASVRLQGTKREKTLKTILVLVEDGFSLQKRKSRLQCLMPNVSLNKKSKEAFCISARQWHACTRLYKKNFNPFFVSPCYLFTCYLFPYYSFMFLMFYKLTRRWEITLNSVQSFKWKLPVIIVFWFNISVKNNYFYLRCMWLYFLCGAEDEDGSFLPLPSPWTHVYSLYIVYLWAWILIKIDIKSK